MNLTRKKYFTSFFVLLTLLVKAQVGIGTTTPFNALDVESNSTTKTAVDINNTSTGDAVLQWQIQGTSKFTMGVDNSDADKFKISTDSTFAAIPPAMTIVANQNIGLGTATPTEKLDIESNNTNKTAVDINNTGGGDPKINFQIGGTSRFSIGIDNSDADKFKIGTAALESNTTVTIDATGNVGIGTTAPTAKLEVDGDAIFNESGAAIDFRVESDANPHMLFIDGTNNKMGINTSTPKSTLDIQGSVGFKVTTITSATTLNHMYNVVLCNNGDYVVTLPPAANNTGKIYYIKNNSSNNGIITIDGNLSETIEGNTTYKLSLNKHTVRIICDGVGWHILDERHTDTGISQGVNCNGSVFVWNDVANPVTGKIWMDRNLGATRSATASNDAESYGDLYQWGRLKDGHQCRTSGTTTTLSATDVPGHGDFIIVPSGSSDWRTSTNNNLWQGVNGINNPCPSGYRVPTETEFNNERLTWSNINAAGAFSSPLKLPMAGYRIFGNGSLFALGSDGSYNTSTFSGTNIRYLSFSNTDAMMVTNLWRINGFSVRCIKN